VAEPLVVLDLVSGAATVLTVRRSTVRSDLKDPGRSSALSTRLALAAALAGPHPPGVDEFARIETEQHMNLAHLHLLPACASSGTVGETAASLVAGVPAGVDLQVCPSCLLGGYTDPDRDRARWVSELRRVLTTYARTDKVADLLCPLDTDVTAIAERAGLLVSQAGTFTPDTADMYFQVTHGVVRWRYENLRDIGFRAWDQGKAVFERAAADRLGTSLLIGLQPPDPDQWAVVAKGRGYWDTKRFAPGYETAYTAALLEGPKLAQTDTWFITPATWNSTATGELASQHAMIAARPDLSTEDLQTAMGLWQNRGVAELEKLIESVAHATAT
jgi:hypothetical protein